MAMHIKKYGIAFMLEYTCRVGFYSEAFIGLLEALYKLSLWANSFRTKSILAGASFSSSSA